jgi:hypothetical protein
MIGKNPFIFPTLYIPSSYISIRKGKQKNNNQSIKQVFGVGWKLSMMLNFCIIHSTYMHNLVINIITFCFK